MSNPAPAGSDPEGVEGSPEAVWAIAGVAELKAIDRAIAVTERHEP